MGCKSYDFLNDSFLFSSTALENNFNAYSEDAIYKELEDYRNFILKKAAFDSAIMIGSLAGTVITGGWSLLGAGVAGLSGYKAYLDYKENLKENPAYLMWKGLKKK